MIKIGSINNSSVFQIGSAGIIKPYTTLANTGAFTEPAPEFEPGIISLEPVSLVPFTAH